MSNDIIIPQEAQAALSIFDAGRFELALKQAEMLSRSELLPKAFQGNPSNCFLALEMAERMGTSPFFVAQSLDIIHGKPGFSAKFLIGCFNKVGNFDPITYQEDDVDGGRCRAISRDRRTDAIIEGPWVSMEMAKKEGWVSKNGSKWVTMPQLMLRYRAASFMIRTTAPEISLGFPTTEELYDTGGQAGASVRVVTPSNPWQLAAAEPDEAEEPTEDLRDTLKGLISDAGFKVAEALAGCAKFGLGDGKTPFSELPDEIITKIVFGWDDISVIIIEDREAKGGKG